MRILIAGGTGFLGRALTLALTECGHHVLILSRQGSPADGPARRADGPGTLVRWTPDGTCGRWAGACGAVDAVVNLAGASIAESRWTPARKDLLRESRILATRSLAAFVRASTPTPAVFVSSSATGYYGDTGGTWVDEQCTPGHGFLCDLAVAWEAEALSCAAVTRVVLLRTGLVLDPEGGALAKMLLPFRLGLGGPFGGGRQYMPWIHRGDWVSLVTWLLEEGRPAGPVNAVAPDPVTNAEYARALGRVLRRPAIMPVPGFVLRAALGEMAGPLLLGGQRATPAAALRGGFTFGHPHIDGALESLLD